MRGRCVWLREISPGEREMGTSGGEREERQAWTHDIYYLNKFEYFIRPIHFFLENCWPSGKYVHLLYMYSILGRGSFCFNYCLNSAWHGGDQFVALLRWYEAQVS